MNKWQQYEGKWETLSKREKILILITVIVVPIVLLYVWLLEPALIRLQKAPPEIAALERSIQSQTQVRAVLQSQAGVDPNVAARKELKQIRAQLEKADEAIRQATEKLVAPEQMLTMLHTVLAEESGVRLLTARSLGVERQTLGDTPDPAASEPTEPPATLYMHPFELVIEGDYQAVYDYLQKLEQLPGVFFWDQIDYQVQEYPTAKVTIKVHTLSTEEGWLGA